ncbi:MAG: hypothetical protein K2P70_13270 [Hyphomonadaceae bacterium]|nr:hypothetical protein [Hyphomonadaceae bacterium]
MEILRAIVGDDSVATTLANFVTIVGIVTLVPVAFRISGSLQASFAFNAQLLHRTFKLVDGEFRQRSADLPPGDESRVFYEVYAISRSWHPKLWEGNVDAASLSAKERAAYQEHVAKSLFLLDRVLRSAPSEAARAAWVGQINKHVFAHGRILSGLFWRHIRIWQFSATMRKLIRRAPNPRAESRTVAS